jgi:hypothetical protein
MMRAGPVGLELKERHQHWLTGGGRDCVEDSNVVGALKRYIHCIRSTSEVRQDQLEEAREPERQSARLQTREPFPIEGARKGGRVVEGTSLENWHGR